MSRLEPRAFPVARISFRSMTGKLSIGATIGLLGPLLLLGCGDNQPAMTLDRSALMDPGTCKTCHPTQYQDWSGSMHAYAGEDPVFLAMNRRAQRDTDGALGDFCVKCHAPVALAEGMTNDGLNLPDLPAQMKGVTCYFCHSASAVTGTHNNPLTLATDGTLFGPFRDPVPGTPHRSTYAALFDLAQPESAAACGGCHDIVNRHGASVERTYAEWQSSLFSDTKVGQTCVRCHMNQMRGPASTVSTGKIRSLGSHALPGVDIALTPFPESAVQKALVQNLLNDTLTGTLCLSDALSIEVGLDNVLGGHSVPSGATPDRRMWAEVVAYARDPAGGERVIYQSGVVGPDQSIETIDDPDAWLIRDCLFDEDRNPQVMFWNAFQIATNQIPGAVKATIADPSSFSRSHLKYSYPPVGVLPAKPDRITLRVLIKPVGDDVIADLIASGDLTDPEFARRVPQFVFAETNLEWTSATAKQPLDGTTRSLVPGLSCVSTAAQYISPPDVAISHARCAP